MVRLLKFKEQRSGNSYWINPRYVLWVSPVGDKETEMAFHAQGQGPMLIAENIDVTVERLRLED